MVRKMLKISVFLFSAILVAFGLLYALSPYLIKNRMGVSGVQANPGKYAGLEALPENGRILFVIAHPDDLEFMAGGTVPKLIERNNDIYMALLTDGGKQRYTPGFYSKLVVKTRHKEQLAIAELQGLKKVFFINYPDGSLKFSEPAVEKVGRIAIDIDATDIFTFEPGRREGRYDSDHDAAGQIGTAVAERNDFIKAVYYFRAAEPDIVIDISDTFEKKLDTMFMFTEFKYKKRMLRALHEAWASTDGRRIGVDYAEVFRRVDLSKSPARAIEAGLVEEKVN